MRDALRFGSYDDNILGNKEPVSKLFAAQNRPFEAPRHRISSPTLLGKLRKMRSGPVNRT